MVCDVPPGKMQPDAGQKLGMLGRPG